MSNPFSNIGNLMKQAREMQQKLKQVQDELTNVQVVGESGAGLVRLTTNGHGEALSIQIDDSVYKEEKKILQGLIVAAINDANTKRESKKKEIMNTLMSGMGLPAGFDFLNAPTGE
jgi:DNA-binding YbaB/EbfC family protein